MTHSSKFIEIFLPAWPDIEIREINEDWDFVVLACDGIWDVLSNEDVCDFVRKEIAQGRYPEEICENLMTKCLAPDCQVTRLICLCRVLCVFLAFFKISHFYTRPCSFR